MRASFNSSLFARIFAANAAAIFVLFVAMYLVSVPFIQSAAETSEERAARTVLDNVHELLEQIQRNLDDSRQSIVLARKHELRNIIAVAESRATRLEAEIRAGRMSFAEARRRLLDELRDIRYGQEDYVWASDYQSVLVSHPDPKLNNADFSQQRDTRGELIVPPMVAGALNAGEGFHSYWWRRLGEDQPAEKISFYKHLPAFKLVIGSGVYIDDIELLLKNRRAIAIDELRQRLMSMRIARTGYMYIFDGKLDVLIHPNANIERANLGSMLEPSSGKPIGPLLVSVADKADGLRYKWDSPDDPGRFVYDKISWLRHFKEFDWYVASSVYVDELNESARILRDRMLMVFAAALLLALVLAYVFARWIADPLRRMKEVAHRVEHGDLDARCDLRRGDEIGVVASAFDGMVRRLQDNIGNLDASVRKRTAELEIANTERHVAETHLGDSEDYNKMMFLESQLAMVVVDPQKGVIDGNDAAVRIYGYASREELFGKTVLDVSAPAQYDGTDSASAAAQHLRAALTDGKDVFEWRHRRPNGELWDGMVHLMEFNYRGRKLLQFTLQDITEQLKAEKERQEIYRLKSDFLTTVSHELRTPTTSIVGFVKLIGKKLENTIFPRVEPDEKTQRAIEQVRSNLAVVVSESERLKLLIDDVLDSAKLDAGKVAWQFRSLAPTRLIERAVAATGAMAEQKGLNLIWRAEPGLPEVHGDEERLQQVLVNLISNAVKFTPQGDVTLAVSRQDRCVRFSVRDTGIGIPAEHLGKVFEQFRQIGDTLTDKPTGTGLGLSICRQIVSKHGGNLWVESEYGKGSVFHFELPASASLDEGEVT